MKNRNIYIFLYILLIIAYAGGLFLQIMEVDAAQYAAMSMEMLQSKSFLKLFDGGLSYLDKPPLLLWLSSLSFYLFGISDFTYRLPSFLASILAVYSTYRLAKQWYNDTIASWSALILASCQAFFLFNQDVKTDNLLTCWVIFSIWQLSAYIIHKKTINFIFGFIGIGLAMLSKGPIGLIVPAAAIGGHLILHRNWKSIFDLRWIAGLLIVFIVLSPMLLGLYEQWGWQGVKFYFWTQSFGRITGSSTWNNDSGYFFFVHTFLWAFLPWTLCALGALFFGMRKIIVSRFRIIKNEEGMTLTGFILVFIALSMSHYKLPHYIFVLFPLAAIFTARWIYESGVSHSGVYKWFSRVQTFVYALLSAALFMLLWIVFQPLNIFVFLLCMVLVLSAIYISIINSDALKKILIPGVILMASINIGLNYDFYPQLMKYQTSNQAGMFASGLSGNNPIPENKFYSLNYNGSHSLNFYARRLVKPMYPQNLKDSLATRDIWLYTDENDYDKIAGFRRAAGDKDRMLEYKSVQNLSLTFLNPATRKQTTNQNWLVHLAQMDTLQKGVK